MVRNISNAIKQALPGIQKNVLLKDCTTYKIGGPAQYFFGAKTKEDLIRAVKAAKEFKLPVFVLGGGSNILVSDKGVKGLVIKLQISDFVLNKNSVHIGAGVMLPKLVAIATESGFAGLEWAAGVPGTVGGAIYGHAQAFGAKISDAVKSVEALDIKTLEIKKLSKKQCGFSLKNSLFKKSASRRKNFIIVSAILEFKHADKKEIQEKIKEYLDYRRTRHPVSMPSAGSTFVNPQVKIKNKKLLNMFPELIQFNNKGVIPAGYLVEKAGLTGKKIGKAQISKTHANFIVNLGGAKAKDVMMLIKLAQEKVKKSFGIKLEPEVQFVGF